MIASKLDEIDRKILRELRADGRISNTHLAEKIGLSTSPCWNRVKQLEEGGIIEGYTVLLNQKALGVPDTVMIEVNRFVAAPCAAALRGSSDDSVGIASAAPKAPRRNMRRLSGS